MTAITSDKPERMEEFLALFGEPQQLADGIAQAQRSGQVLSNEYPRLLAEFSQKWIALRDGEVIAANETLDGLLASVEAYHPGSRSHILVQFIDNEQPMLFLVQC